MSINTPHPFCLQQGVHIVLAPGEVTSVDSGIKMVNFILKVVSHLTPERIKQPSMLHQVTVILASMVVDVKSLANNQTPLWTDNLQEKDKLEIQIFLRLCVLKVFKMWEAVNVGASGGVDVPVLQNEIIMLISHRKIRDDGFDTLGFMKTILGKLEYIACSPFDQVLRELFESLELTNQYLEYLQPPQTTNHQSAPVKYQQRSDLMREISIIDQKIRQQGKATTSTKLTGIRSPAHSLSLQFKQPKIAMERTLYFSHPMKYTFKRKTYGYY